MSESVHWAKDRKTWLMAIGGLFIFGGVIGALLDRDRYSTYLVWILVGLTWAWEPVCEKVNAPKWVRFLIIVIAVCAAVYALYSLIHHHR